MATVLAVLKTGLASSVPQALALVPRFADGCFESADIGFCSRPRYVTAEIRLEDGLHVARAVQRLAFWFARAGGWAQDVGAMSSADIARHRDARRRCEIAAPALAAPGWLHAVSVLLGVEELGAGIERPSLVVDPSGPACDAFRYEATSRVLWVPSPLAPPPGELLDLSVRDGGEVATAHAVVSCATGAEGSTAAAPAGFSVEVEPGASRAHELLASRCAAWRPVADSRATPRFRLPAPVRVSVRGDEETLEYRDGDEFRRDFIENLSHGGAFVRTAERRRPGEQVVLRFRLPGGDALTVPGAVVYRNDRGVGVQFTNPRIARERLAAALTSLPGRAPRVLVVDDDGLVRAMLVEALAARGFDAVAANDGEAALRAIADQLFSLDAVITDLHMPALGGDALVSAVRHAGGERDLVIVMMAATLDPEKAGALARAGADAVIAKERGVESIVAALERALSARAGDRGTPSDDPFVTPHRTAAVASAGR